MLQRLCHILRYVPLLGFLIRGKCRIVKLPYELLSMIFSELSLPSKACFAVTCKVLFEQFGNVLKDRRLAFPHPDISYDGTMGFLPRTREREELLLRLEGRRKGQWWLSNFHYYCGDCLILHPAWQITWYGDVPPEERRCIYPGVVALCSCVHLNARRKIRLIDDLEAGKIMNPHNWHECSVKDPAGISVDIQIGLSVSEMRQLLVHIRYVVRPGVVGGLQPRRIMICSHCNIYHDLDQARYRKSHYDCLRCQTDYRVDGRPGQTWVQGTRNLGGKSHPVSRVWSNQCELGYRYKLHK